MDEQILKNEYTKKEVEDRVIVDKLLDIIKEISWGEAFLLAHNLDRLNELFLSMGQEGQ